MMADLRLTVLQRGGDDRGVIAGFAVTSQLIFAVGGASRRGPAIVASSNARDFEARKPPRELGLCDALAIGDALWVCGEYGQLAVSRDSGASWELVDSGTDVCLLALACAPDGTVWVAGDQGYVARLVGGRAERIEVATSARLVGVHAHAQHVAFLGGDGNIYRWHDGDVIKIATGAARSLSALITTKLGTWIVVGEDGFAARSPDGAWFSRVTTGVAVDLEAIGACADGLIVCAGDRGTILTSHDDGRTWRTHETELSSHLWSVERFGAGVLIGGDRGVIARLAPPGDETWSDRINVFGGGMPLDAVFAAGPAGFIGNGLSTYLEAIAGAIGDTGGDEAGMGKRGEYDDAELALLDQQGGKADFERTFGVPMPAEASSALAAVGTTDGASFAKLRLDAVIWADVGDHNLFELLVRRDQQDRLGTGLVEAFCGVFRVGSLGNGDTYHMELYAWDGPRQVLHYDHDEHAFSGVLADSLDSLTYLAAIKRARELGKVSADAYTIGLRKLYGKVAPAWQFSIRDDDPGFVAVVPKRRDTEFFFFRSRWILALLANDGVTDIEDIARLFNADFNQVVPQDQLPARFEACERFNPTALYSMWRAYLFDEPELARYLEIGRRHRSRIVRDAATLIDELRGGRNELGTIKDVRAHLARFRALDLDPRRAEARKAEAELRAMREASRKEEIEAELARTPQAAWADLAWRWLDDGVAHRVLLRKLDDRPEIAAQIAALDELRALGDEDREVSLPRIATELSSELEAILVGSLVRGDALEDVLEPRSGPRGNSGSEDDQPQRDSAFAGAAVAGESPSCERVLAALAFTERALRLVPDDENTQFTHAMLLLDADAAGIPQKLDELVRDLPRYSVANRLEIVTRLGKRRHPRFGDLLDAVLTTAVPDVDDELVMELGEAVLESSPARMAKLVPLLPADVTLLSTLGWKAIQADHRDHALALYERLLVMTVPDSGEARANYLRAMNNACMQAHAAKEHDTAVRIADRAQPFAHENPYIYHSAACAYAAVGDYAKAFEQVKLAIQHDYDQLGKVEIDHDLGQLLDWPEFKALFRDWRARRESN